jgi:hypothetical protein
MKTIRKVPIWLYLPVSLVCGAVGDFLGDLLFICMQYGHRAYFDNGLRIAKHKPRYTLSTGIVLSENLTTLGWFLDCIIWLGLSIACVCLLSLLLARSKPTTQRQPAARK